MNPIYKGYIHKQADNFDYWGNLGKVPGVGESIQGKIRDYGKRRMEEDPRSIIMDNWEGIIERAPRTAKMVLRAIPTDNLEDTLFDDEGRFSDKAKAANLPSIVDKWIESDAYGNVVNRVASEQMGRLKKFLGDNKWLVGGAIGIPLLLAMGSRALRGGGRNQRYKNMYQRQAPQDPLGRFY